ncbi:hypothetical protein [Streptomyces sp. NPDC127098]|uniref:hypothetical protein n=1 Tax=Streptomyces sp. NPDC127098 TaxID=3347137 RepID=UPI00365499A6
MSLTRLVLVFDRNTPSFTSVPSGSVSTWVRETVTEPNGCGAPELIIRQSDD